jgi:hypothetical protein
MRGVALSFISVRSDSRGILSLNPGRRDDLPPHAPKGKYRYQLFLHTFNGMGWPRHGEGTNSHAMHHQEALLEVAAIYALA